jgi:regulator of sigma E protease
MLTLLAFVVAITVLIGFHEYGHYRVAVACGVRVRRFGIATLPVSVPLANASWGHRVMYRLAKPVLEWTPKRQPEGQNTVFAIGLFPLAGYVQMVGQGDEADVTPEEEPYSFKNKPVSSRFAIVAAGPIANLLLAILLYAAVNWVGIDEPRPILGSPVAGSIAAEAGLQGGETVARAGFEGDAMEPIQSFEELRWMLTRGALDGRDLRIGLAEPGNRGGRHLLLPLSRIDAKDADAQLLRKVGIISPWSPPAIGDISAGGAAERSGLQKGDVVRKVAGKEVGDAQQLRDHIRAQIKDGAGLRATWEIDRGGRVLALDVTPDLVTEKGAPPFGRIGAYVGAPPAMVLVRHGPVDGLWNGLVRTWEVSELTLRMMGRMIIGQASLKNLSGPVTIADYAGKSASLGLAQYLTYLALISVSLGVLNLLPIPVLDGGHLMYYLWEAVTGKAVSEQWMERLQRGGLMVLLVMMSIALFNDGTRYIPRLFG